MKTKCDRLNLRNPFKFCFPHLRLLVWHLPRTEQSLKESWRKWKHPWRRLEKLKRKWKSKGKSFERRSKSSCRGDQRKQTSACQMQQRALMSSDKQKCCCAWQVEACQGKRNSYPLWCPFSFLVFITQDCVQREGAVHRMTREIYIVSFSFLHIQFTLVAVAMWNNPSPSVCSVLVDSWQISFLCGGVSFQTTLSIELCVLGHSSNQHDAEEHVHCFTSSE